MTKAEQEARMAAAVAMRASAQAMLTAADAVEVDAQALMEEHLDEALKQIHIAVEITRKAGI